MVGRIVLEKVDIKNVIIFYGIDDGEQGQKDGDSQVIVFKFFLFQGGYIDQGGVSQVSIFFIGVVFQFYYLFLCLVDCL